MLVVHATPDFDDDRTTFSVDPAHYVRPGGRVVLTLSAFNAGSAAAESVTATFELPDAMTPVRNAVQIDGRPIRERKKEQLVFDLGRIDAEERVELRFEATIASPLPDSASLPVAAVLSWEPSTEEAAERRFERAVVVRSEPVLPARRTPNSGSGAGNAAKSEKPVE